MRWFEIRVREVGTDFERVIPYWMRQPLDVQIEPKRHINDGTDIERDLAHEDGSEECDEWEGF